MIPFMEGAAKRLIAKPSLEQCKPGSKLLFTNTDSFCYWIPTDSSIDDEIKERTDWFDFSNFPKNHPNYDIINKLVPGMFKDEMGGEIIVEFCGLRSKMYSIKLLNG